MPDSEIARAQLVRQRRFLVITSLALVARYVLAIDVGDSVALLGAAFKITKPDAFVAALWVVWLWATVRYAQFFRDLGRIEIARAKLTESHRVAMRMIRRSLQRDLDHPGMEYNGRRIVGKVAEIYVPEFEKPVQHGWTRDHYLEYQDQSDATRSYRRMTAEIRLTGGGVHMHDFSPTVTVAELKRAAFWGWLRYVVRTHYFSEYYAPFVIAALAPLAWIGSLAMGWGTQLSPSHVDIR